MTDGRTEAIAISPSLFKKTVGIKIVGKPSFPGRFEKTIKHYSLIKAFLLQNLVSKIVGGNGGTWCSE